MEYQPAASSIAPELRVIDDKAGVLGVVSGGSFGQCSLTTGVAHKGLKMKWTLHCWPSHARSASNSVSQILSDLWNLLWLVYHRYSGYFCNRAARTPCNSVQLHLPKEIEPNTLPGLKDSAKAAPNLRQVTTCLVQCLSASITGYLAVTWQSPASNICQRQGNCNWIMLGERHYLQASHSQLPVAAVWLVPEDATYLD